MNTHTHTHTHTYTHACMHACMHAFHFDCLRLIKPTSEWALFGNLPEQTLISISMDDRKHFFSFPSSVSFVTPIGTVPHHI